MLLSSSLPAQAASATGSSRIATHFADIPKCNPLFKNPMPRAVLDRPPEKWNSHLGYRADVPGLLKQFRPDTIGEAMARAGPDVHGRGGAMWIRPRPRISFSRAWWRAQRT